MDVGNGEGATTVPTWTAHTPIPFLTRFICRPHCSDGAYYRNIVALLYSWERLGQRVRVWCLSSPARKRHKLSCVLCSQLHSQSLQLPAFSIEPEQQGPRHLGYHLLYHT